MRLFFAPLIILVLAATALRAQQPSSWDAVGRLDIDGKGFCTGTLIAPDLVLTAAHCLFDRASGGPVDPSRLRFLAGLSNGQARAERGLRAAAIHPSYVTTDRPSQQKVRHDVALLRLDRPIATPQITPFELSTSIRRGTQVGVMSYGLGRENAPLLQETCNTVGQQVGVLIFDCDVTFGASGSPVFRMEDGALHLVSLISAMADINGEIFALGMDLAEPIAVLTLALEDPQADTAQP